MVAKHVNKKNSGKPRVFSINALLQSLLLWLQPSVLLLSFVTFNDAKPPPSEFCANLMYHESDPILGDPGAVSRAGLKGATKVFKHGRKSPWADSHRTISKRSRECWFLIGHKKCFVLLCPIGEQSLQSPFLEFVHDGYYPATVAPSSETQEQSVGSGEKAERKSSSTGERALGYRLSSNYFQKFKQMPAPDWAQKVLCIIVPNRQTVSSEFFSWVRTWRLLSCTCTGNFYFYFPNQKRRNYRWVEKTFGMLSAGAIQFAPRIFCFWLITIYRK